MKLIESKSDRGERQLTESLDNNKSESLESDETKPVEPKMTKMTLLQQQVASVKEIADEFKIATKPIANRSDIEQLNIAVQLGVISKEDMQGKIRNILKLSPPI